jgi:hypothetical protein
MNDIQDPTMQEPRISKRALNFILRGLALLALAGVFSFGGWLLRGEGSTQASNSPTPTTIPLVSRSAIVISEDVDGKLLLNGQSVIDLNLQLRETHFNVFSERVPVSCDDSFAMIRSYFAGTTDPAAVLAEHRGDIEAISGIARHLCVYEQYRRFLNKELFGWLYAAPVDGATPTEATTGGAVTTTTVAENK